MNIDYVKQLEETVDCLKRRLESELMGKAVIDRTLNISEMECARNTGVKGVARPEDFAKFTQGGRILVGCIVFAKIVKRKDGWYGYVLTATGETGYKYSKFVMRSPTFDDACERCMKALALDEPTSLKIYSIVGDKNE
jgi:hypothetical protein